jgi:hypothetical protein
MVTTYLVPRGSPSFEGSDLKTGSLVTSWPQALDVRHLFQNPLLRRSHKSLIPESPKWRIFLLQNQTFSERDRDRTLLFANAYIERNLPRVGSPNVVKPFGFTSEHPFTGERQRGLDIFMAVGIRTMSLEPWQAFPLAPLLSERFGFLVRRA